MFLSTKKEKIGCIGKGISGRIVQPWGAERSGHRKDWEFLDGALLGFVTWVGQHREQLGKGVGWEISRRSGGVLVRSESSDVGGLREKENRGPCEVRNS